MSKVEPLRPANLLELAQEIAAVHPGFSLYHGKLFSLIIDEVLIRRIAQEAGIIAECVPNKHPVVIVTGDLSSVGKFGSSGFIPWVADRKLNIYTELSDRKLPKCSYLALISPVRVEGDQKLYLSAYEAIAFARAFLALHLGKVAQYTWVCDFDFDASGQLHVSSPVFRMPMFADFFGLADATIGKEIVARLVLQSDEYRKRLQRACDFVNSALNQPQEAFRFSSYWIALEVLVGGRGNAIRSRLASAYGQSETFVDVDLRFRDLAKVRHALIHRGEFGTLQSYQERLFHLYFWDIVRFQIGLPCRELARLLVTSGHIEAERKEAS